MILAGSYEAHVNRELRKAAKGEPAVRTVDGTNGRCYLARIRLPGVLESDIRVRIRGREVSVEAVRRAAPLEEEGRGTRRREKSETRVFKKFDLPAAVDKARARVRFRGDVLTLLLSKLAN